jgi:hypothetical protein
MTADCGLRGLDLLDAAISQIEDHPETWHQGEWRCKSGMCLAGHIATLAGAEWLFSEDDLRLAVAAPYWQHREMVAAEPGDEPWDLGDGVVVRKGIPVMFRAQRLLGVSAEMAEALGDDGDERNLFGWGNTLADIKAMRDALQALPGVRA